MHVLQASAQYSLSLVGPHMRGIPAEYSMRVQNSDRSTVHVLAEGLEHKGGRYLRGLFALSMRARPEH